MADKDDELTLKQIARELVMIRQHTTTAISAIREAESEVPEKMRRFANYFHDVVHIKGEYVSLGLKSPEWIDREMERCDDRFRQILKELHSDGGPFEKIRRKMADDPENRWDHTRLLGKPKETTNEARQSNDLNGGVDEAGADVEGSEPLGSG